MDIQPLAEARKKIRGPSAPQTPVGMTQNVPALSAAPEARPCVRDTSRGQAGEAIQEKDPGFFASLSNDTKKEGVGRADLCTQC